MSSSLCARARAHRCGWSNARRLVIYLLVRAHRTHIWIVFVYVTHARFNYCIIIQLRVTRGTVFYCVYVRRRRHRRGGLRRDRALHRRPSLFLFFSPLPGVATITTRLGRRCGVRGVLFVGSVFFLFCYSRRSLSTRLREMDDGDLMYVSFSRVSHEPGVWVWLSSRTKNSASTE